MNYEEDWFVTNDSVMGGLSAGKVEQLNNLIVFSGNLSTENNGGFTSTFRKQASILESVTSITIRILGDGNCFQLRFRTKVSGYEVAYQKQFSTRNNEVTVHTFLLSDFHAVFRGRILDSAPVLEPQNISHVGFLTTAVLIKKDSGNCFTLSIYDIDFHP